YVRGSGPAEASVAALNGFSCLPAWMCRNTEVLDFVGWLRGHNDSLEGRAPKCGFYGLALYSLYSSIRAVIDYLDRVDPEAAWRARFRYACFEHFHESSESYGYHASMGITSSCEQEVISQ